MLSRSGIPRRLGAATCFGLIFCGRSSQNQRLFLTRLVSILFFGSRDDLRPIETVVGPFHYLAVREDVERGSGVVLLIQARSTADFAFMVIFHAALLTSRTLLLYDQLVRPWEHFLVRLVLVAVRWRRLNQLRGEWPNPLFALLTLLSQRH